MEIFHDSIDEEICRPIFSIFGEPGVNNINGNNRDRPGPLDNIHCKVVNKISHVASERENIVVLMNSVRV